MTQPNTRPDRLRPDRLGPDRLRTAGVVVTAVVGVALAADAVTHVLNIDPVRQASAELGLPGHLAVTIGVVEALCLALYLVPRTAVLGAVLLTGYLGGAVLANLRVDKPLVSTVLSGVYVGIALWAGLYLRDGRVRDLLPLRASR